MESYEQFALRHLALLRANGASEELQRKTKCPQRALSTILFHGMPVLPPLLTPEERRDMRDLRQRAVQAHADRQKQLKNSMLTRVQNIFDLAAQQVHLHKEPSVEQEDQLPPPKGPALQHEALNGYTLVMDPPGLLRDPGCTTEGPVRPGPPSPEPHQGVDQVDWVQAQQGNPEECGEEEGEEEEEEDISLDSLLKRSREYVEKEQSRHGSTAVLRTPPPPPESLPDQEDHPRVPRRDSGVEFSFSLRHSPVGTPTRGPSGAPCRLSPDPQRLPTPEPVLLHPVHRPRKPRPVSAGNLHISFPMGQGDLIPRSPGWSEEARGVAAWGEAVSVESRSSDPWGVGRGAGRRPGRCDEAWSPALSPLGPPGFRRRSHTLDSQLYPAAAAEPGPDRSQERLPRFMAGVTRPLQGRRTSAVAPLNHSYDVEAPSPGPRPHVSPDMAPHGQVWGLDPAGPKGPEARNTKVNALESLDCTTEETQWRVQALEDMQKRLEEEHVLQMSLLLAEQEKEQERLQQELEENERRLMGQGCERPLSGNGLPSPSLSTRSSPSGHVPVCLWGSPWGASAPRSRLSQVLTQEQQNSLCRLGAVARGFLTRRLLATEKVKHLRQTVMDTQEFIRSFQSEGPSKRQFVSPQDISLQDRVRAQLRAALYDLHDIFFETPLQERLALLQQDRELRAERRLREMEKAKSPKERVLSAATQRSLDRKNRVSDSPAQTRRASQKVKACSTNRTQNTNPGQNTPALDKLKRQGSCYRKAPDARNKRSAGLKKQNSVG